MRAISVFANLCWVVLVFVTAVFGRPLYLLAAEPNECMVWSVDPNLVPYIGQVDVNEVWGRLLPPGPDDVNDWELACGKYQRPPARACDPEGDPISISCLGGTSWRRSDDSENAPWISERAIRTVAVLCDLIEADQGEKGDT